MENIAFCSGGKDSVATLIVAKEKGEPLDGVAFAEVMFDKETSGEHPLHREFVYNTLRPFVEKELQVPFYILRSDVTYTDYFTHTITRGENKGKIAGFPIAGMCAINRDCKMRPIDELRKGRQIGKEYVGIAADEPIRLERLDGVNKISLLAKYNYTEADAKRLCQQYGLLSPVYDISKRNGCWFCMNCNDNEFIWLLKNRRDLFDKLIALEKSHENLYRNCLTRTETPQQIEQRLYLAVNQLSLF